MGAVSRTSVSPTTPHFVRRPVADSVRRRRAHRSAEGRCVGHLRFGRGGRRGQRDPAPAVHGRHGDGDCGHDLQRRRQRVQGPAHGGRRRPDARPLQRVRHVRRAAQEANPINRGREYVGSNDLRFMGLPDARAGSATRFYPCGLLGNVAPSRQRTRRRGGPLPVPGGRRAGQPRRRVLPLGVQGFLDLQPSVDRFNVFARGTFTSPTSSRPTRSCRGSR